MVYMNSFLQPEKKVLLFRTVPGIIPSTWEQVAPQKLFAPELEWKVIWAPFLQSDVIFVASKHVLLWQSHCLLLHKGEIVPPFRDTNTDSEEEES